MKKTSYKWKLCYRFINRKCFPLKVNFTWTYAVYAVTWTTNYVLIVGWDRVKPTNFRSAFSCVINSGITPAYITPGPIQFLTHFISKHELIYQQIKTFFMIKQKLLFLNFFFGKIWKYCNVKNLYIISPGNYRKRSRCTSQGGRTWRAVWQLSLRRET